MNYSMNLPKVKGILARFLRASRDAKNCGGWAPQQFRVKLLASLGVPLSVHDLQVNFRVMLLVSQPDVDDLLENPPDANKKNRKGRKKYFNFASLSPFKEDGIWYTGYGLERSCLGFLVQTSF